MLLQALNEYLTSSSCLHVCNISSVKKLANSNLMQAYIESLIRFDSTMTKLLTFLLGQEIMQPAAVLQLPGQHCGTVCLNSFSNRTSPLNNLNDRWKRLCLVSWAAVPCVWTLRALTRNLLAYLHSWIGPGPFVAGQYCHYLKSLSASRLLLLQNYCCS